MEEKTYKAWVFMSVTGEQSVSVRRYLLVVTEIASLCAGHPVRTKAKTLEFGTEKGLLPIHARRWVTYALRTPKLLKAFRKSL